MAQQNLPTSQQAQAKPPANNLTIQERQDRMIGFIQSKSDHIAQLLGSKESYDRFKSVVLAALHKTPEMVDCDPKSFVDSCLACANDGLVPDGRRAALVAFNDRQAGKKICSYIPMIRGIIECMHRTGYVKDVQQDVVYKGEPFTYKKGLNPVLDHEPQPDLRHGDENIIWAYAVVTTVNGGSYPLAMTRGEIDKIRAISKTDKVWKPFFAEMAKKTVLRNLSKSLPFDLDVFRRDDDMIDLNKAQQAEIRTARLTHNPADTIEEEPETKPEAPQERQEAAKTVEPAKDTKKTQKAAPEPSLLDDDDIPAHIRDAPPIEGELVPPASHDTKKSAQGEDYAEKVFGAVSAMRSWTQIDIYLMTQKKTPSAADFWNDDDAVDALYLRISKLDVWQYADDGTLSYSAIKRAIS